MIDTSYKVISARSKDGKRAGFILNNLPEANRAYQFTNKHNYTTRIYVLEITNKSVYYTWADETGKPTTDARFRMSRNSFNHYTPMPTNT